MLVPSTATSTKSSVSSAPSAPKPIASAPKRWTRPLLAGACLALMVILACAPARNHEFWLHLGLGKAFSEGRYTLGEDPLLQRTTGYFANPSWFAEFLAAQAFDWFGPVGLDVIRLILLGAVAWLMALLAGFRTFPWLACGTTLLALVALGPWLTPRPMLLSYLFLALFLFFLDGAAESWSAEVSDAPGSAFRAARSYWPLWALQVLWVNCDQWFLLGPVVIFLHALGGFLAGQEARRTRVLLVVFGGSLLVCLLNPHHFRIWQLPISFGFFESYRTLASSNDLVFRDIALSPLALSFRASPLAQSPGGIALVILAVLELFAFAVNLRRIQMTDLLVFLFFLAIGLVNARAIPFFVIVSAPIAARNLQNAWQAVVAKEAARQARALAGLEAYGRFVVGAACVLLLAAGWPGWLQGTASEPRRFGVVADPSLKKAAETVAQWRREDKLNPEARGFNLTPDVASYFAAFSGGEKMLYDGRLSLLSESNAREVLVLRGALQEPKPLDVTELRVFREFLRRLKIGYVVIHAKDPGRFAGAIARCFQNSEEWPLLFVDGPTLIFGWRDPAAPDPRFAALQIDFLRWVVHPRPEQVAPPWSGRDAEAPSWWNVLRKARADDDPFAQEANLHLFHYDSLRGVTARRNFQVWSALAATNFVLAPVAAADSLAWSAGLPTTGFFSLVRVDRQKEKGDDAQRISVNVATFFLTSREESQPEHLFLGVRAARRGIAANPQSPASYLALGEAYVRMAKVALERNLQFRTFPKFRHLQAVVAFQQALTVDPNLYTAHVHLVGLYQEMGLLDLALEHARIVYDRIEKAGRNPGESAGQFDSRLKQYRDNPIKPLTGDVDKRRQAWEAAGAGMPLAKRAVAAFDMGLAKEALDLLLKADRAAFDRRALILELRLLQVTGRVKEARTWIDLKDAHLASDSSRLTTEQAMVVGDYEKVLANLDSLLETYGENPSGAGLESRKSSLGDYLGFAFGRSLLDFAPGSGALMTYPRLSALQSMQILVERMIDEAELHTVAGLLSLEAGDPRAREDFIRARSLWLNVRPALGGANLPALPIVEEWLSKMRHE
ncbi:MAG: hypothetical protein HY040_16910 [Planctomycetes bacterium]|nr:hypothetical protein [Planctomycetota bacterium]